MEQQNKHALQWNLDKMTSECIHERVVEEDWVFPEALYRRIWLDAPIPSLGWRTLTAPTHPLRGNGVGVVE